MVKCLDSQFLWDGKKRFILKNVIFDIFGTFPMPEWIQRDIEDFKDFTAFSPYGMATKMRFKCLKNHQFFIFRKNKQKLT